MGGPVALEDPTDVPGKTLVWPNGHQLATGRPLPKHSTTPLKSRLSECTGTSPGSRPVRPGPVRPDPVRPDP
eukprot:8300593-Karenia_brevis.AAC.1